MKTSSFKHYCQIHTLFFYPNAVILKKKNRVYFTIRLKGKNQAKIYPKRAYEWVVFLDRYHPQKIREIQEYFGFTDSLQNILNPSNILPMTNNGLKQAAKRIYGKGGKQAINTILETRNIRFQRKYPISMAFKGLLSYNYLTNHQINATVSKKEIKLCRRFLKKFTETRRMILIEQINEDPTIFLDLVAIQHLREIPSDMLRRANLRELHDFVLQHIYNFGRSNIISEPNEEIKYKDHVVRAIDSTNAQLQNTDLRLILPQDTDTLKTWGYLMHNCIYRLYRHLAVSGQSILVGVLKNGKLTYNIELKQGKIRQFYAACNQHPEREDYDRIVRLLG